MLPAELADDLAENDAEPNGPTLSATGPSPLGLELSGGDPGRAIAELDAPEGRVRVQDQGSQLAALALTRSRPVRAGERWLDLCAGPGGKTAVLGAEALVGGATVRANEVSEHRAELVRRSVAGVAEAVEVVSHDGREDAAYGGETFDRILVDAPCTGLGALRRRPEARWRKQLVRPSRAHRTAGRASRCRGCAPGAGRHPCLRHMLTAPRRDPYCRGAAAAALTRLIELDAREALRDVARGDIRHRG